MSASKRMPYRESCWERNFCFPFCKQRFKQQMKRDPDMTKTSKVRGPVLIPNPKARLFDQAREVMRFHHYALRTEESCAGAQISERRAGVGLAMGFSVGAPIEQPAQQR